MAAASLDGWRCGCGAKLIREGHTTKGMVYECAKGCVSKASEVVRVDYREMVEAKLTAWAKGGVTA